jgi:hypothetical protein
MLKFELLCNSSMDNNVSNFLLFRIIVLDKSQIVEFDRPDVLLSNEKSVFYSMAVSAGIAVPTKKKPKNKSKQI